MTEQEAKEKPIHEVWEVADYLIRLSIPHLEKLASPDNIVNEQRRPIYKNQLANCRKSLEMLRRVLLERCDNEFGVVISKSMITNRKSSDLSIMYDYEAKAWSSVLDFLAWELDRQTKEQEGGEG